MHQSVPKQKPMATAISTREEAVRVFWSGPSTPDCQAAAPRTPKEFLEVQGVQTCNRCGWGCWPWRGLVFQLDTVENLGAILLFRTALIERLCAMPMCQWRNEKNIVSLHHRGNPFPVVGALTTREMKFSLHYERQCLDAVWRARFRRQKKLYLQIDANRCLQIALL